MPMCAKCEARIESGEAKENETKLGKWMDETGLVNRLGSPETPGGAFVRDIGLPLMATVSPVPQLKALVVDAYLLGISAGAYVQAHGLNDATTPIPTAFTDAFEDETPQGN